MKQREKKIEVIEMLLQKVSAHATRHDNGWIHTFSRVTIHVPGLADIIPGANALDVRATWCAGQHYTSRTFYRYTLTATLITDAVYNNEKKVTAWGNMTPAKRCEVIEFLQGLQACEVSDEKIGKYFYYSLKTK